MTVLRVEDGNQVLLQALLDADDTVTEVNGEFAGDALAYRNLVSGELTGSALASKFGYTCRITVIDADELTPLPGPTRADLANTPLDLLRLFAMGRTDADGNAISAADLDAEQIIELIAPSGCCLEPFVVERKRRPRRLRAAR